MSLQHAAQHLAAQGRGPDDHLIHMSGKEVAGLQALAKAAGGSLTVNPQTGLPEAGFLDNLLPSIVGAGISYFSGGTIDPMTAAAMVGGEETLRTGDLGRGLMSGLGAYGGAGMMGNTLDLGGAALPEGATDLQKFQTGASYLTSPGASTLTGLGGLKTVGMAAAPALMGMMQPKTPPASAKADATVRPYAFEANPQKVTSQLGTVYTPGQDTSERQWFQPHYTALPPYQYTYASGGPVEQMSDANAVGQNTGYPQAAINQGAYATPWQTPISRNMVASTADTNVDPETGAMKLAAGGGISDLGAYSDGGRLLRGPGDGVSDSIPAQIGAQQPARLADGEFVVPARIVSELGNGSTEAGARQLYKMMDRVQQARGKTTGKSKVAKNTNAAKYLPA